MPPARGAVDKVRFTAPTKIGDTIHVELEVLETQDKGELGGVIGFKNSVKNQQGVVVTVSIMKVMLAKRPAQS